MHRFPFALQPLAVLGMAISVQAAERFEYCVIGAGPGGVQLGYYLETAKRGEDAYPVLSSGCCASECPHLHRLCGPRVG